MEDYSNVQVKSKLNVDFEGDVSSPLGFIAGGMHTGLRKHNNDFGWIFSTTEAQAAGVYTLNRFKAAPLIVTQKSIAQNQKLLLLMPMPVQVNKG